MKLIPEMVDLSAEQARKQIELVAMQSKEILALAEKLRPKHFVASKVDMTA